MSCPMSWIDEIVNWYAEHNLLISFNLNASQIHYEIKWD